MYRDVLHLDHDTLLSIDDNFFHLGGHSLSATRLIARTNAQFASALTLRSVFDAPTIGGLAAVLDDAAGAGGDRATLSDVVVPEMVPASFGQQSLWVIDQLGAPKSQYVVPTVIRLTGSLDTSAFAAAVHDVVARHATLRTLLVERDNELTQTIVATTERASIEIADLRRVGPRSAVEQQVHDHIGTVIDVGFDLATELPIRVAVLRIDDSEWTVVIAVHHHAIDEWSTASLFGDLSIAYSARLAGGSPDWSPLPVTYAQYATWQRATLGDPMEPSSTLAGHLRYWRDALADAPEESTLATDHPRPAQPTHRGGDLSFVLDTDTVDGLRRTSTDLGVSMFMISQAATAATVSLLGSASDVVIGSPVGGRTEDGLEDVVGYFVNTLPLRHRLYPRETFAELLTRVRQTVLDGFAHQSAPFEGIVRELGITRSTDRTPLFQILLTHIAIDTESDEDHLDLPGVQVVPAGTVSSSTVKTDLELDIEDGPNGITGSIAYAADLFTVATIERFVDVLTAVMGAIAHTPHSRIVDATLIPEADRARTALWKNGIQQSIDGATLDSLVRNRIQATPDAVAVVDDTGTGTGTALTYRQFDIRIDAMTAVLVGMGVTRGDRVAVMLPRSIDLVVTLHAVVRLGAAYVPIDPAYPSERIGHILDDATPCVTVSNSSAPAAHPDIFVDSVVVIDDPTVRALLDSEDAHTVDSTSPSASDTAYVIFTSGTTGRPKGVMVSHQAIVNRLRWMQDDYGITERDRVLLKTPAVFDVSVWEFFLPFVSGATLVVARDEGHRDADYLTEVIERHRVTVAHFVPAMLAAFLAAEPVPSRVASLRRVFFSGEALPASAAIAAGELFGRAELHNLYGPTEAAVDVTSHPVSAAELEGRTVVPIGRPVTNTSVRVLDSWLRDSPVGVVGELYLGGVQLAAGYIRRSALTAQRFVADPRDPGLRLYRTGDLVRWNASGALEYLGRSDDQVKIRGFRIELDDIRTVVEAHPAVSAAVVIAADRPGGGAFLVAYHTGGSVDRGELTAHVAAALPDYMVPTTFVRLDALPTTANGKLDRRALPSPEMPSTGGGRAPSSDTEHALAQIFRDVLSLGRDVALSVDDDFFGLGGDSISSIQVVSAARRAGLTVTAAEVFAARTVAALARTVDHRTRSTAAGPRQVRRSRVMPIAAAHLEEPGFEEFTQSYVFVTPGEITVDAVRRVMTHVAAHHRVLHAGIERDDTGAWFMTIPDTSSSADNQVVSENFTGGWESAGWTSRVDSLVTELSHELDPHTSVMWRAVAVTDPGESTGRLVVVAHHLVVDGVSWRILEDDLAQAWALDSGSTTDELLGVGTDATSWTAALERRAHNIDIASQLDYWGTVVDAIVPVITDRPLDPSRDTVATTADIHVTVPAQTTETVLGPLTTALSAGVDDILVGALAVATGVWRARRGLGTHSPVVGLEGHGRDETTVPGADLSRSVGWFTTWYPVAADIGNIDPVAALTDPNTAADAILRVKESLASVPAHGLGYGVLRYLDSSAAQRLTGSAVPDLAFNYLGRFTDSAETAGTPAFWRSAPELPGIGGHASDLSPAAAAIDINVAAVPGLDGTTVIDGTWTYAGQLVTESDAQELADLWVEALATLAQYAATTERIRRSPSDMIASGVTFADIAGWEERYGDIADVHPLTPLQHGMVFESLVGSESGVDVYVTQNVVHLTGTLDPTRLSSALDTVLETYPNLRAAVTGLSDGDQVAVVPSRVSATIEHIDLTADNDPAAAAVRIVEQDRTTPFVLDRPPLLRLTALALAPAEHRVVLTMHHVLADGWSTPSLITTLLEAYRSPDAPVIPDRAHPAFLRWLATRDTGATTRAWTDALVSVTEPTLVAPTATGSATEFPEQLVLEEGPARTAELFALARSQGSTLSTLVQSAWAVTLNAVTGLSTVSFGTTVSGRPAGIDGIEHSVGMFVDTVPTPVRIGDNPTLIELMGRVHRQNTALLDHHHVGLPDLHRIAGLPTLFDTLVVYENYPIDTDTGAADTGRGLTMTEVDGRDSTHYPLTLAVIPGRESTTFEFSYAAGVVTADTVSRIATIFTRTLDAFVSRPGTRVAELDLVPAFDRDRIARWASGAEVPDTGETLSDLISAQITRTPDSIAVRKDDGVDTTYRELDVRVQELTRALLQHGVTRGTRAAVLLPRSLDLVVTIVAIVRAGAAYVPIDPDNPTVRVAQIVEDATPTVVVTDLATLDRHQSAGLSDIGVVTLDDPLPQTGSHSVERPCPPSPEDAAYVLFTSGTTGRPKGVVVSHRAAVNLNRWMQSVFPIGDGDLVLQKTSIGFDVSVPEFFWPLITGGAIRLIRPGGEKDLDYLAQVLRDEPIAYADFVPTALLAMVEQGFDPDDTRLRYLAVGGELFPGPLGRTLARARALVLNVYGPTETTVNITAHRIIAEEVAEASSVPIGTPVSNTVARVLDAWLRPVPIGVTGELYLGGAQLADGYVGRPALTSSRFVPDPFGAPGNRLYRTGDLVQWNESGALEYLGRSDDQVKIRGFRIELDEVRSTLELHPEVSGAALAAADHPAGGRALHAYFTLTGTGVTAEDLRAFVASRLPEYMVPSTFTELDRFPTTPNGKLDRRALPTPDFAAARSQGGRNPESVAEVAVAQLFRDVLRTPNTVDLSVDEDFFRLGGDSILAARLVSLARRQDLPVTIRDVFEKRTIGELAESVTLAAPTVEAIPLLPSSTLERLRESGSGVDSWVYTEVVQAPAQDLDSLRSAFLRLVSATDALRISVTAASRRLWTSEVRPAAAVDPARQFVAHTSAVDIDDAAAQSLSMIDVGTGHSAAVVAWVDGTGVAFVLAVHSTAADRSSVHRMARVLMGADDTEKTSSLAPALEAIENDGQELDADRVATWVAATDNPTSQSDSMWAPGRRIDFEIGLDEDVEAAIDLALRGITSGGSDDLRVDLEVDMLTRGTAAGIPLGPFTATWPSRARLAAAHVEPKEFSLLRFHNRTGRKALRRMDRSDVLVTRTYGLVASGELEGIEAEYRCVVRYRIESASVAVTVIGMSDNAVDELRDALSSSLDRASVG
ncbi:amino acid adenylation domain-containing protein [Rhodococcus sp. NPDC006774]|uniref:amino acid adenylation domain-containing protein n=1 Tax=Rhodococcus sp. NPDC006774 TaxID=3157186 RepID=UPI0033FC9D47